ncbi:MAG: ATP-binding protein [Thermoprotei archaeon]|nr:MAG: ATP-binding protein [Thermoprotei archaeon]
MSYCTRILEGIGTEIGFVASGATAYAVPVVISKKYEHMISDEQLVIIHDTHYPSTLFLGVLRKLTRYEPFLRERVRTVYVDYPELISESELYTFTNVVALLYAELDTKEGVAHECIHAPFPGSKVYLVERGEYLSKFLRVNNALEVGVHKFSDWVLPLDPKYLTYHVGVFGATGTGKSRLIKALIDEILKKTDYSVIVFDHTGVDYVPFYRDYVVPSDTIKISPPLIASVIAKLANLSWSTYGDYLEITCMEYVTGGKRSSKQVQLQSICREVNNGIVLGGCWSKKKFIEKLTANITNLGGRRATARKAELFIDYYLDDSFFDSLNQRVLPPKYIVEKALRERLVVVDLSRDRELAIKQAIVKDVMEEVWRLVKEYQRPVKVGIVIDEAQNYVSEEWSICGDVIETTVREGRKWQYFVILASQRVARDIRPSVRANLGTVFFSRLQATGDLRELGGYLDLGGVTEASLAQLGTREFFVAGLMNPLRRPILIKVREVS